MPTSRRTSSINKSQEGMTLIEILIVIGLISLVLALAMPGITSALKISLDSATHELASTIREAYHSAVVTGKIHRVVYDIEKNEYWVEAATSNQILLDTTESIEKEKRKQFGKKAEETKPAPQFNLDKTITRKKRSLPRGVRFEDILTTQRVEPFTTGQAYTHLFPHGLAEKTVIHIKDQSDHQASLVLSAVSGKTTFIREYVKNVQEN